MDSPGPDAFQNQLFAVTVTAHRSGQGGEDDVGCEQAALRVYFNIGMCAAECMLPHLSNGPGVTQTPIDLDQCRSDCPDFSAAEASVCDLCAFMQTTKPPKLETALEGLHFIDESVVERGKQVFDRACAQCHSNGEPERHNVYSDDLIHPASDIGTNSCRASPNTVHLTILIRWEQSLRRVHCGLRGRSE